MKSKPTLIQLAIDSIASWSRKPAGTHAHPHGNARSAKKDLDALRRFFGH